MMTNITTARRKVRFPGHNYGHIYTDQRGHFQRDREADRQTDPVSLFQPGHHDDRWTMILPYHSPEVRHCVWQRALHTHTHTHTHTDTVARDSLHLEIPQRLNSFALSSAVVSIRLIQEY